MAPTERITTERALEEAAMLRGKLVKAFMDGLLA